MTDLPSYDLQLKAAEERRQLHESVSELKCRVRDRLDVKRNADEHLFAACGVAALVALAAGYGLTGIFVHN